MGINQNLLPNIEHQLQKMMPQQTFLLGAQYTGIFPTNFAPESFALRDYLLYKIGLSVKFNDLPIDVLDNLIIEDTTDKIDATSREGVNQRNKAISKKMGLIQNCGAAHIGGVGTSHPHEESIAAIAGNRGKRIIAPFQSELIYWQKSPEEAKQDPSIKHMPLPGREFFGSDKKLETAFLSATMKAWGYGDAVFNDFQRDRKKAQNEVERAFRETLTDYRREYHPIRHRVARLFGGI